MTAELEAIALCHQYGQRRWSIDYYATAVFASMVTIFGVVGNAATLLTLSGRRLTTATFVYYRTIAEVDLCRCIFVFTYVFRVLIPFRRYYWTTWYEAHFMYFAISTLGFISTSLAVFLCFRLCTGIVKSTRLKKTKTNPRETRTVIYGVLTTALLINVWLCFEYDVLEVTEDDCSLGEEPPFDKNFQNVSMSNQSRAQVEKAKKFSLAPSEFNFRYSILLKAVHNIPTAILLILLGGTVCLLVLCVLTLPGLAKRTCNSILTANNATLRRSKPWRTQRQLCRLFIFLSVSYGAGLLPSLLHYFVFGTDVESISERAGTAASTVNRSQIRTQNATLAPKIQLEVNTSFADLLEQYERDLADLTRRHVFATVMNVFQNFAHALSFYVYAACSEAFRNEFLVKLRHAVHRAFSACPCLEVFLPYLPMDSGGPHLLVRTNAMILRNPIRATSEEHVLDCGDLNCGNDVRPKFNSAFVVRKVLLSEGDDKDESEQAQLAATVL